MKKIKKILCVLVAICLLVEPTPRSLSAEQTAVPNDPVDLLSIQSGRYSPGEISRVEMMTERKESLRSSKSKVSASFYEPQFSEERVIVKLASRTGMRSYGAVPDLGIEYEGIRMLNPSVRGQKARAFSVNEDKNDVFVLTLKNPGKDAVEQALETLNSNPNVEIAEPDYYRTVNTEKKEETKEREGSEEEDEEEDEEGEESLDIFAPELIDAIKAWEITSGSKDVVVGVIDTGIDGDHPELEDNLWVNPNPNKNGYANDVHGYDFVDKTGGTPTDLAGHGTHVAGIIGAGGAGDSGFQGISPNVSLAWLGVGMGDSDMISDSACIEALNYADNCGIPITNNSYGGAEYSTIFEEAIRNYDGLFVAAAGNEEMNNDEVPNYPANFDCPNIISVTSTDRNDNLSWFSNYGENTVHIAAPGEEILSTYPDEMAGEDSPGELYAKMSGTSMAAPHVAGAAALVLAQNPKYSSEDVRAAILGGANHLVGLLGMVENCRRLDAYRALAPRPSIDRLTVSAESDTLDLYDVGKVNVAVTPAEAFQAVIWESSDTEIVKVNSEGYVVGLAQGTADITARSLANPDYSDTITVMVSGNKTNAVPFADMNFKQTILDNLQEMDPDTYSEYSLVSRLTAEDAAKVESVDVSSAGVEDLTGLEALTNLKSLICSDNSLYQLDVRNNTALEVLVCSGNEISVLNLKNNAKLEQLDCSKNPLGGINLTHNTRLKELYCSETGLNYLELSKNTELSILNVRNNNLSSLDLEENPELTELWFVENPAIREMDLSHNPELTKLYYAYGNLADINLNGCDKLEEITLEEGQLNELDVSDFKHLRYLYIGGNQIRELDVDGLTELEVLDFHDNQVQSFHINGCDVLEYLVCHKNQMETLSLGELPMLWNLDCDQNQLTELDLSGLSMLDTINCQRNQLTELDVSELSNIRVLYCHHNQFTELDVSNLSKLEEISCGFGPLTELNVSHLSELLLLDCSYSQLSELDVSKCKKLDELNCVVNQLSELNVKGLPELLSLACSYNQLTELDVSGASKLFELSCGENQLTQLNISGCGNLNDLYCGGNRLDRLDLTGLYYLYNLGCEQNQIKELALDDVSGLQSLSCGSNDMKTIDVSALNDLMELACENLGLTELDLSGNMALTNLKCSDNELVELNTDNQAYLQYLDCANNNLAELDVKPSIQSLLCGNNQLVKLELRGNHELNTLDTVGNPLKIIKAYPFDTGITLTAKGRGFVGLDIKSESEEEWDDLEIFKKKPIPGEGEEEEEMEIPSMTALAIPEEMSDFQGWIGSVESEETQVSLESNGLYNMTAIFDGHDQATPGPTLPVLEEPSPSPTIPAQEEPSPSPTIPAREEPSPSLTTPAPKQAIVTVAFHTQQGSVTGIKSQTFVGETLTLKATPKKGYLFSGWYDETGRLLGKNTTYLYKVSKSAKLEAKFKTNKYKIYWKLNKGKIPSKIKKHFKKKFQFTEGVRAKQFKKIQPIRKNWKFVGWYTKKNLKGKKQTEIRKTRCSDITLYAKWKRG